MDHPVAENAFGAGAIDYITKPGGKSLVACRRCEGCTQMVSIIGDREQTSAIIFYTNDRAQSLAAMEPYDVLLVNSRQDGVKSAAKEWASLEEA